MNYYNDTDSYFLEKQVSDIYRWSNARDEMLERRHKNKLKKHEVITYVSKFKGKNYHYHKDLKTKDWIVVRVHDKSKKVFRTKKEVTKEFDTFDFKTIHNEVWKMPKNIHEMTFDSLNEFILFYKNTLQSYLNAISVIPCKISTHKGGDPTSYYGDYPFKFESIENIRFSGIMIDEDTRDYNFCVNKGITGFLSIENIYVDKSTFLVSENSIKRDPFPNDGNFDHDADCDNYINQFNEKFSESCYKYKRDHLRCRGTWSNSKSLILPFSEKCIPSVAKIIKRLNDIESMSSHYASRSQDRFYSMRDKEVESRTDSKLLKIQKDKIINRISELTKKLDELYKINNSIHVKQDAIKDSVTDHLLEKRKESGAHEARKETFKRLYSNRACSLDGNFEMVEFDNFPDTLN